MLILQDQMNTKVHPEWRQQHFKWYRAIWLESAELMDHHGWKWWKKQTPNISQIKLEVVDIWHFGLSLLLQQYTQVNDIVDKIQMTFNQKKKSDKKILDCVELFASEVLAFQNFPLNEYYDLMLSIPMTFDELYRDYIAKNVLNFFRQEHGYQLGTYKKNWNGREDNEHLVELMYQFSHDSGTFYSDVYEALEQRYSEV